MIGADGEMQRITGAQAQRILAGEACRRAELQTRHRHGRKAVSRDSEVIGRDDGGNGSRSTKAPTESEQTRMASRVEPHLAPDCDFVERHHELTRAAFGRLAQDAADFSPIRATILPSCSGGTRIRASRRAPTIPSTWSFLPSALTTFS